MVAGDGHSDPFLYSAGKMTDAWKGGTEYGGITVAINNSGHYVVNYFNVHGETESFLYNGTVWTDLGIGGATGMNDSDTIVGNEENQLNGYWVYSNYKLNTAPSYTIPGGARLSHIRSITTDGSLANVRMRTLRPVARVDASSDPTFRIPFSMRISSNSFRFHPMSFLPTPMSAVRTEPRSLLCGPTQEPRFTRRLWEIWRNARDWTAMAS
jgi:hypothetical protein